MINLTHLKLSYYPLQMHPFKIIKIEIIAEYKLTSLEVLRKRLFIKWSKAEIIGEGE